MDRLWRTVKHEDIYIHDYDTVADARTRLRRFFLFYNDERFHKALAYQTSA